MTPRIKDLVGGMGSGNLHFNKFLNDPAASGPRLFWGTTGYLIALPQHLADISPWSYQCICPDIYVIVFALESKGYFFLFFVLVQNGSQ